MPRGGTAGRGRGATTLTGMAIRVVLAEDSVLLREGVRALVDQQADVEIVATCSDYDELLAAVDEHEPDVVVTDIRMPPTGTDEGIRAAEKLREERPDVGVVVLSQYADPAYARTLFDHGSAGRAYLLKERLAEVDELVDAIQQVAEGGSVVDPRIVETLVEARRTSDSILERLTPRESEVLEHMATGKNNAGIARALVITERAVEKHISSILAKLDLSYEEDDETHRRVRAVLLFLAETGEVPDLG